MPCSKYSSKKQRGLCYLTHGWKDWTKTRKGYSAMNPNLRKVLR